MLLDNSIVVLENIYRHKSLKKGRDTSVILGTKEVWRSITAATLTTITVFLPFVFSSNALIKVIGRHIGVSIISTLLVSLLAALLLIPMLIHTVLGRSGGSRYAITGVSNKNRLMQVYVLLLKTSIRLPVNTILAAIIVFFVSIGICTSMSRDVPEEVELKQFTMYATMPGGTTLETSSDIVGQLEEKLADIEEIQDRISTIYEDEATITIVLKDEYEEINERSIPVIKEMIEERIDDFNAAEVSLSEAGAGSRYGGGSGRNSSASFERMFGIGSQQERILVKGNDYTLMREVADDIEYNLNELETIDNVRVNVSGNQPEIHLLFNKELMSQNDISLNAVSSELSSFESEVSSGMNYKQGTEEYEILIRNETLEDDKTFDDLKDLPVTSESNALFALDQFSRIIYSYGISGIRIKFAS
jgi:multidrug efflux pump subunit AcrB